MEAIFDDIRFRYAALKAALLTLERRPDGIPRRVAVTKRMALPRHWLALDHAYGESVSPEQAQLWMAAYVTRLGLDSRIPEESVLRYVGRHGGARKHPVFGEAVSLIDELMVEETE